MSVLVPAMSRVIVAVDRGGGQDFVLELAREVVPAGALEMLGLFVENARLLEPQALERQLRAEASRARAEFETAATRIGVPHAFQIARGDVAAELLRRANEAQALIVSLVEDAGRVGHGLGAALRELFAAPLPLLLIARRGWLLGESIAVVVDDSGARDAMLTAAARIARLSGSPIVTLAARTSAAEQRQTAERVAEALAAAGVRHVESVMLNELTTPNVVAAARTWRARLVVLPASSAQSGLAADLVSQLSSALLLVGAQKR